MKNNENPLGNKVDLYDEEGRVKNPDHAHAMADSMKDAYKKRFFFFSPDPEKIKEAEKQAEMSLSLEGVVIGVEQLPPQLQKLLSEAIKNDSRHTYAIDQYRRVDNLDGTLPVKELYVIETTVQKDGRNLYSKWYLWHDGNEKLDTIASGTPEVIESEEHQKVVPLGHQETVH
jgi:hypothetical protein